MVIKMYTLSILLNFLAYVGFCPVEKRRLTKFREINQAESSKAYRNANETSLEDVYALAELVHGTISIRTRFDSLVDLLLRLRFVRGLSATDTYKLHESLCKQFVDCPIVVAYSKAMIDDLEAQNEKWRALIRKVMVGTASSEEKNDERTNISRHWNRFTQETKKLRIEMRKERPSPKK